MKVEETYEQLESIPPKNSLRDILKKIYIEELAQLHRNIKKFFVLTIILFFGTALITFIIFNVFPDNVSSLIEKMAQSYNIDADPFTLKESIIIFLHNFTVCVFSIFFGMIPFVFIPAFTCISNGYALGLVLASYSILKENVFLVLLTGVVPHAIFEIPVILYSFSIGIWLCKRNTRYLITKKESDGHATRIIKAFKFIVIPALLIAALIETFVTPILMNAVK
ncbi:stage II sporulation protein M [Clostridium sp.]|uniref:stage II sporulation protein M n=1 Tax=Clostridium sp. TaxID=1506 RepID=UPI002FC65D6A